MSGSKKKTDKVREQQVTYEIYAAMPDADQRYEVIDGVLEMMSPSPTAAHQGTIMGLISELNRSCISDYILYVSPLDVILSETNVVQPDLLMIHRSRLHIVTPRAVEGAPDLVVEIVSPGSRKRDKLTKMVVYAQHAVPEYWIVDSQARTLEQHRLNDDGRYELCNLFEAEDRVHSDKLPCVAFMLNDVFKDVLH